MSARFRIGIDLGGTKTEIAALDHDGQIVLRERTATPRHDYPATVRMIAALVAGTEARLGGMASIGIGIPGAVSPTKGLVRNANSTWLIGKPFDRDLAAALGRPVRLANDANCFALSEAVDGAGKDGRLVFGIIAGTGCGGGLVLDRKVWTGRHAIAGEWGHNPLPWPRTDETPGPACYCGKQGCLETWISGPALAANYRAASGCEAAPGAIANLAAAGDAVAGAVIEAWLDRFARGLAAVINILDPDVVVIGGGLSNLDALYTSLPARLGAYVFSDHIDTPIRQAAHGDSSGVRGAAWLWNDAP